jgi:hypothetical protein
VRNGLGTPIAARLLELRARVVVVRGEDAQGQDRMSHRLKIDEVERERSDLGNEAPQRSGRIVVLGDRVLFPHPAERRMAAAERVDPVRERRRFAGGVRTPEHADRRAGSLFEVVAEKSLVVRIAEAGDDPVARERMGKPRPAKHPVRRFVPVAQNPHGRYPVRSRTPSRSSRGSTSSRK